MFRIKLALLIGGGVLAFFGIQEVLVSYGTDSKADEVDLKTVEDGQTPESNHAKIGEHMAIFDASVYAVRQAKHEKGEPGPGSKVEYCFYPIISNEHPYINALRELADKHGGLDNVPEEAAWPDIQDYTISMLVKTKKFKTVGTIPDGMDTQDTVQGLIINQIDSLDSEEEGLVKESFPKADLEKVLILEDGRKPASLFKSLGMTFGGILLSLGGVGWLILGRRQE